MLQPKWTQPRVTELGPAARRGPSQPAPLASGAVSHAQQVIAVFGASQPAPGDGSYEQGVRCGSLLADAGFAVVTGGYGGLMQAVSEGAAERGGRVIGVTAPSVFSSRSGPNPHVTEELRAASLTERIHQLTQISDASIVLQGSLGTMTELLVAWNLAFVARFGSATADPIITVGRRWERIVDALAAELGTDRSLVTSVATVDDAVAEAARSLRRRSAGD